jgi:hypothetical protein
VKLSAKGGNGDEVYAQCLRLLANMLFHRVFAAEWGKLW